MWTLTIRLRCRGYEEDEVKLASLVVRLSSG